MATVAVAQLPVKHQMSPHSLPGFLTNPSDRFQIRESHWLNLIPDR